MAQNQLASPAPAVAGTTAQSSTATASPQTTSNNNKAQSPNQQRLAVLKVKRQELEKRLQEKNNLLQELCRKEAHLIGVYPTVTVAGQEAHHQHNPSSSADDIGGLLGVGHSKGPSSSAHGHNTHSLPRKIGTGFTLSEKYLNKRTLSSPLNAPLSQQHLLDNQHEDELHNLLLQRDIQQQICKASLKLLNDVALTKSVRRKHKISYEVAQQKLLEIGHGLTLIQQKRQLMDQPQNSQTLPLTVKTTFKVPQPQQGYSPKAVTRNSRHDSHLNAQHSPLSIGASYPAGPLSPITTTDHIGHGNLTNRGALYRSSSNSSSLNNANALGKSSLSLDNATAAAQYQQHQQQQQQYQQQNQQMQHHSQAKPTTLSYESKSLHNFHMSSPNYPASTSFQSSPHHHPALLSPTFYNNPTSNGGGGGGVGHTSRTGSHYPSSNNTASLRQSHQQQIQFMSTPPQQVVIPQSGLGGYWTLNEHNERVWCASSVYSPEPSGNGGGQLAAGAPSVQRHAATLDRKAAIYVANTSASHAGKLKMPSPEASPTNVTAYNHNPHHPHQQQQQHYPGASYQTLQDGSYQLQQQQPNNNHVPGKPFAIVSRKI